MENSKLRTHRVNMRMYRRAFLKGCAAVPLTAAIGVDATIAAAPSAAAAGYAAMLPAHPWRWWFRYSGWGYDEVFIKQFDTKEAAMEYLSRKGDGVIAECQRQDFDLTLDGESVFEMLMGQNEGIIDASEEDVKDLGVMVSDAIEAWVRKHKIDVSACIFGGVRNEIKFEDISDTPERLDT
jgi:secreted PhoX family phosphatase